jgi:hypothetical protein
MSLDKCTFSIDKNKFFFMFRANDDLDEANVVIKGRGQFKVNQLGIADLIGR